MSVEQPREINARADKLDRSGVDLPTSRLVALGARLMACKFEIDLTHTGLLVRNPEMPSCCENAGRHRGDTITCRRNESDGYRLWYFTSWRSPIAEATQVTEAVAAIKRYLSPDPNTIDVGRGARS
jgi:hypothetical protein